MNAKMSTGKPGLDKEGPTQDLGMKGVFVILWVVTEEVYWTTGVTEGTEVGNCKPIRYLIIPWRDNKISCWQEPWSATCSVTLLTSTGREANPELLERHTPQE